MRLPSSRAQVPATVDEAANEAAVNDVRSMKDRRQLDLITIGRSSVDLYGEQVGGRLEDMGSFVKYLGGCPANIAAGAARLGLKTALLTRVGDDHMGRFIEEQLRREGVNTDAIVSDSSRLTALVILGIRDEDRFPLLFYRENCADMALCEDDVDPDFVRSARAVLITGTHLSRPGVRAASLKAVRIAKANGGKVILDGDYRPVLWGLTTPELGEQRFVANEDVTRELQAVLPDCDLIVGTEEELHILGGTTDTYAAVCAIRELTGAPIVHKRGERGCIVYAGGIPDSLDDGVAHDGFPIEVFNVLGAGDAFMSGFLRGWLRDEPLQACCRLANAAGALVVSRHGCTPASPSWEEMQYFLEHGSPLRALRHDPRLEHIHWATNRAEHRSRLDVLALDNCPQLESLANGDRRKAARFLELVVAAAVNCGDNDIGLVFDGVTGKRALERMSGTGIWTGRSLDPDTVSSAADEIREWPVRQVVVCRIDTGGAVAGGAWQGRMGQLFRACRKARHELLLDVSSATDTTDALIAAIEAILEDGTCPDWWELPAALGKNGWERAVATIAEKDGYCHGVLVNGRAHDLQALAELRSQVANCRGLSGVVFGPAVYADLAERWFAGKLGDSAVIDVLRESRLAGLRAPEPLDRYEAG